jgi:hypothetical protein
MLLSFRAVNHRSLRDEQHLNLAPVYDADRPPGTSWPAVPVAAVYGANASGKSNLIDALDYMRAMVLASDREAEPGLGVRRNPFLLDPDVAATPSSFDIDVLIDGTHYSYGFSVDDGGVAEEWLYRYPNKRRQVVFSREGRSYRYGTKTDPDLREAEGITAENVLFTSVAARAGKSEVQPLYRWMRSIMVPSNHLPGWQFRRPPLGVSLVGLAREEPRRRDVLDFLRAADTGIEDFGIEYVEYDGWSEAQKSRYRRRQREIDPEESSTPPPRRRIWFHMRGAKPGCTLELADQSDGTRLFLQRMLEVLDVLAAGSLMAVDELEANLHPHLAGQIVRLFQDPVVNPLGAQLIFTTHDTSLLGSNAETLKRDQVWFVEKDFASGASRLFPLTDFRPRDTENTERRYRGGSYRAVPFVDEEATREAVLRYLDRSEARS